MTERKPPAGDRWTDESTTSGVGRRRVLALGAGAGAALLAGCATETGPNDDGGDTPGDGDGDATATATPGATDEAGRFRLLISDRPAAIDDFDELNVSFDRARVFRAGEDDAEDSTGTPTTEAGTGTTEAGTGTATDSGTETPSNATAETETTAEPDVGTETDATAESDDGTETDADGDADDGERGFFIVDLGGATVDLTQVVGEKAVNVFDGGLAEGRYAKIELHVADVEGIVDGETVGVKVPSGKLQIVKPFEVVAGETLSFVFDINVVEKGRTGEYNLLPVISESGVGGEDVEVEEVGTAGPNAGSPGDDETDADETDAGETDENETDADDSTADGTTSTGTEAHEGDRGNGEGQGPPDETDENE